MSLRFLVTGWRMTLGSLSTSAFFLVSAVVQPLIFATVAFYMALPADGPHLVGVGLDAGLIGAWSATVIGAGSLLHWERWQKTLELLVAAPRQLVFVILPMTLGAASLGLYSLVATLMWGWIAFGMPLTVSHPLLLVVAVLVTTASLGTFGIVLAGTFVLSRHATILTMFLSYPVWMLTGLLVPLDLLPEWVTPFSSMLSLTWGARAIEEAFLGGDVIPELAACGALGVVYIFVGSLVLRAFLRLSRERATLSLA